MIIFLVVQNDSIDSTQCVQQSAITFAIFNLFFFVFICCFFISDVYQPLSQIRMSLAGSLGAAQVIFLGGINATENTVRNFPYSLLNLFDDPLTFLAGTHAHIQADKSCWKDCQNILLPWFCD